MLLLLALPFVAAVRPCMPSCQQAMHGANRLSNMLPAQVPSSSTPLEAGFCVFLSVTCVVHQVVVPVLVCGSASLSKAVHVACLGLWCLSKAALYTWVL